MKLGKLLSVMMPDPRPKALRKELLAKRQEITPNVQPWVFYQLYDHVSRQWTAPYATTSRTALAMEMLELQKKHPNRDVQVKFLGRLENGLVISEPEELIG